MSIWDKIVNAVSSVFSEIANTVRDATSLTEGPDGVEPSFVVTEEDVEEETVDAPTETLWIIIHNILADFEARALKREQWIRENAYFRWENSGRPEGRDLEFWLAGEADYFLIYPW